LAKYYSAKEPRRSRLGRWGEKDTEGIGQEEDTDPFLALTTELIGYPITTSSRVPLVEYSK
jgi:hypothetical protein